MAFRSPLTSSWKSMLRIEGQRRQASSTAIKNAASKSEYMKGEYAPIYIVMGFVGLALMIATHTAKQQLMHAPAVNFSKKKRETMAEVDDPDTVINSADKFINKSFLRKVAHIQDDTNTLSDPVHPDPFNRPRTAETLKTAGVDPTRR